MRRWGGDLRRRARGGGREGPPARTGEACQGWVRWESVKGMVKSSAPRSTSARSAVATSSGVPAMRPPRRRSGARPQPRPRPGRRCWWRGRPGAGRRGGPSRSAAGARRGGRCHRRGSSTSRRLRHQGEGQLLTGAAQVDRHVTRRGPGAADRTPQREVTPPSKSNSSPENIRARICCVSSRRAAAGGCSPPRTRSARSRRAPSPNPSRAPGGPR